MKDLYEQAKAVLPNSYAKYSHFKVAAAIRLNDGTVVTGVNVENASFGLTNCAERTALFSAYTKGYRKEDIQEMVITTEKEHLISPCGACRQVMSELMTPDTPVHMITSTGTVTTVKNKELLPLAFQESDM